MFKICQIRSFSYVARSENYAKIQQHTLRHLRSNGVSSIFLLRNLDLHFTFQMFKIYEFFLYSYVAKQLKLWKNSVIHIQTFAIKWPKSRFSPVILTYIFDFKCLKCVKFVRFRMLPEAKSIKNSGNTHSNIWNWTAEVLFFYPLWSWPTFSMSTIFNFVFLETVTASANISYGFKYLAF